MCLFIPLTLPGVCDITWKEDNLQESILSPMWVLGTKPKSLNLSHLTEQQLQKQKKHETKYDYLMNHFKTLCCTIFISHNFRCWMSDSYLSSFEIWGKQIISNYRYQTSFIMKVKFIYNNLLFGKQVFLTVYHKNTHLHICCQFSNLSVPMKPRSETMMLFLLCKPSANPSPNMSSEVISVWIVQCQN